MPQCRHCGLFSKVSNSQKHWDSVECKKFAEKQKLHCKSVRQDMAMEVQFFVSGQPIKRVSRFRYLGRILSDDDDDNHAALRQLNRAKEKWAQFNAILRSQGASPCVRGYFYKAVVQAVLLYGSESWTLTESTLCLFRSFHSRVARHLTSRNIRCLEDGTWHCPPTAEVLQAAGLETIYEYIQRRKDTVRNFVWTRSIYQVCRRRSALAGGRRVVWWRLP